LLLVGLTLRRLLAPDPSPLIELSGRALGTIWSVKLNRPDTGDEPQRERLLAAIREALDGVDSLMSTYRADSELSRFNRFASTEPFALSAPTLEVFALAQEISELTDGAFDVTVGPLVAAWGFGADEEPGESPSQERLAALRERVGYRLLRLDSSTDTIAKLHPEVVCDLSAIAKGYAVDEVVAALRALGHRDFLVEVGGELGARGRRPDGTPWRVAIERPDALTRSVFAVVGLDDRGMATSGDYRNFYQRDGVRLSHLIDPRAGRPIAHRLASVTVVDPQAARADALATALSVLGPEEGFALATREKIPAYFILRMADDQLERRATPSLEALLLAEPGSK
jgi:thiamine biosynthesis lipoprotein